MTKAPPWGVSGAALAAVCGAALLLAGCDHGGRGRHHVITAKVIDTIKAGEVRWNEDYKSGDPSKVLAHFASDGIVIAPGAAPVVGAGPLRSMVTTAMQDPHFRMRFSSDEVEVPRSGEFATARGAYAMTASDPATKAAESSAGSYVAVYKPAGDGRWLVAWLMTAPGPKTTDDTTPSG